MSNFMILDAARAGKPAGDLEQILNSMVVGQDDAIHQVVRAYQAHLTGFAPPCRPISNLLFLGPTGTGKTRVVEALAEALLKDPRAVTKIDCAEFQHSHEIAKLIGSPPGYLGHRETQALLTQEALNKHHTDKVKLSFVLFDEIEKASDAVWNLLLGILDKGTLTLGDNRRVDFSSAMIFMTSNCGAAEIANASRPAVGFHSPALVDDNVRDGLISRIGVAAARRKFTPEFMNRLDKVVVFKPLGSDDLNRILDIELAMIQERIHSAGKPFVITVAQSAREELLAEGTDVRYGARHLKRAIERMLVQPLSNLVASGQVRRGDTIRITHPEGAAGFTFAREARTHEEWAIAGLAA